MALNSTIKSLQWRRKSHAGASFLQTIHFIGIFLKFEEHVPVCHARMNVDILVKIK